MNALRHRWRRLIAKMRNDERGQSVMEYALAISVVVVAAVAASWPFFPAMQQGIDQFGNQFNTYYAEEPRPKD